ncbi:helix-turn-helix domain-containing protein [Enterococcus rivorum]|uniref:Mga helix-turn-helix domain-containing protein n=1 Tax=Enterococcus rivorum TaxID=762845 RepID=A0A1E5KYQ7_9ENTE|nr:helix-turn-helix domain-containing protein [Enterococcus rivorum]MBP2099971.1 hypothetical protein [Enterococcus rivorum]OEH82819.1 hypothetical protein BCR26_11360 [Enterococcus rivorum]
MYKKMLSTSKQKELLVLYSIIQKKQTLHSLSINLNIPKHTVKNYIQNLNYEIEQSFTSSIFIESNKKGEYWIPNKYSEKKILVFHELKLDHLKKSSYFQLLVLLTTNFQVSSKEVTEKLFITSSYLTRITKTLNKELVAYGFQITNSKTYLSLTGDEFSIRLFSFIFLNNSFQLLEWPFEQITKEELAPILPKETIADSTIATNSVYFWFAIVHTRVQHQAFLPNPDIATADALNLIKENYHLLNDFNYHIFSDIEKSYLANESLYFIFASLFILSDIVPYQQMVHLGTLFSKQNFLASEFSKLLIDATKIKFNRTFTDETESLFIYFFTIMYLAFQLLNSKSHLFFELYFPRVSYIVPKDNPKRANIEEFFDVFLNDFFQINLEEEKEAFVFKEIFYTLIYRLLLMGKKVEVFIYLRISKDITGNAYFKNKISQIFNPEVVLITDNIEEANLIVADTFEFSKTNKSVFVLGSSKKYEQWVDLTQIIQKMILKKLFSKEDLD